MIFLDHKKFELELYNSLDTLKVPKHISDSLIKSIINTSLRGVDSHGVNLFPHYYEEIKLGKINKTPNIKKITSSNSVCVLDADNTIGHYVGEYAINTAIEMAKETGVGIVSVKNSTHFGAAAYFTDIAANQNMIGFAFTNTEALVNAFNSKEAFFGTNPFCFSAPMPNEDPFCLDMATSTIPWNKVKNYRRQNLELEEGWAYDKEGIFTTNPHLANSLTAIGGYKGYGLGMVIEILCSGLASGPLSKDIIPMYDIDSKQKRNISHFFMVMDITKFLDINFFKQYISSLANRVRELPKSSDEQIYIPGDKEKINYKKRIVNGIPMDISKYEEFLLISNRYESTKL